MDPMALINKQMVELSDEERIKAESFHKSRLSFAWIRGFLVFNTNQSDDRDHHLWLKEEYNVSDEKFEMTPRGYMMPGRIQLFVGSDFMPVIRPEKATGSIELKDIGLLVVIYSGLYRNPSDYRKTVPVYDGVTIGKVGELWERRFISWICS